jgi:hypothetical protein
MRGLAHVKCIAEGIVMKEHAIMSQPPQVCRRAPFAIRVRRRRLDAVVAGARAGTV